MKILRLTSTSTEIRWSLDSEAIGWSGISKKTLGYEVFEVEMLPQEFLDLVPSGSHGNPTDFIELAKKGKTFFPPYLFVNYLKDEGILKVTGHEGRTRMLMAKVLEPNKPVIVTIRPRILRNGNWIKPWDPEDVTDAMKTSKFEAQ